MTVSAQDANGIYGNVYGCAVVAPTSAAWTQIASADMKDTSTGAALTAGLFLSSLSLVSRDAWGGNASFICLGLAASCPAATTNAPKLDAGTAKSIEVRGVLSGTAQTSITTLSLGSQSMFACFANSAGCFFIGSNSELIASLRHGRQTEHLHWSRWTSFFNLLTLIVDHGTNATPCTTSNDWIANT
jgi:hypothetical protein